MPPCTIIPVLGYRDMGEAIAWLCTTFGFNERWRAGNHRAQLVFDGGVIVVTEQHKDRDMPLQNESFPQHSLLVRVEDADKHFEQARQAGASIVRSPEDYPFGERQYTAEDIGGHQWTFSQSVKDVAPEDWGAVTARKY